MCFRKPIDFTDKIVKNVVTCFPSCVCVLQNQYHFIVKSFKYDYYFDESVVGGR